MELPSSSMIPPQSTDLGSGTPYCPSLSLTPSLVHLPIKTVVMITHPLCTTRQVNKNLLHYITVPLSPTAVTPAKFILSNKTFILNDLITSHNLDFLILTETWLKIGDCCQFVKLCPLDYSYLNFSRCTGHNGGRFDRKHITSDNFQSFEMLVFKISCQNPVCCISVYCNQNKMGF